MNKIGALVTNRNRIGYTQNLVLDLKKQTQKFDLTIMDQASTQPTTQDFLKKWAQNKNTVIIRNEKNMFLNHVWNSFYKNSPNEYLCFLNNDMRLTDNFMHDTQAILEKEPSVGCVIHATNHEKYLRKRKQLKYAIVKDWSARQGWDWCIRRKAYSLIPEALTNYCGDDYIFHKLYEEGWKVAIVWSSPVLHYFNVSVDEFIESFDQHDEGRQSLGPRDSKVFAALGFKKRAATLQQFSHNAPSKQFIKLFLRNIQ